MNNLTSQSTYKPPALATGAIRQQKEVCHHEQRLNGGTGRTVHDRLERKDRARKCVILLRNYSCARMRIEEAANTDEDKKYRESVRLVVGQGNGIEHRSVKGLHDRIVKISTLDWVEARKSFGLSKATDINSRNSQPSCMFIAEIG